LGNRIAWIQTNRLEVRVRSSLDARYGRTPARRRTARWWAIGVALAVAAVVVAWVAWVGLLGPDASVDARTSGYTVVSDAEIEVEYEVTVAPGMTASCALEALNEKYAVIGWKIVDLPASSDQNRSLTDMVRTSEPAVTGLIYRCWLT
jgi:hypothetical protein